MLRRYGFLGFALLIFAQLNIFLRIQPFVSWYIPIVWYGYILLIDNITYRLKKKSLIKSNPKSFLLMIILSVPFWLVYEFFNMFTNNWYYINYEWFIHLVNFTTILPAIMETNSLFNALKLFEGVKMPRQLKISKKTHYLMISIGLAFLILPLLLPVYFFWTIWISMFLLLDPINCMNNQPSVLCYIKRRELSKPLYLCLSGLVCGFLWEYWNFWSYPKWFYTIPFVDFFRVFQMPLLGYLGYMPFALSLFAMYNYTKSLF